MKQHPSLVSGAARRTGTHAGIALLSCLLPCVAHAVVLVRAGVADSPFEVSSNFNNRGNPVVSYEYSQQTPVPGSLPPLFGLITGSARADGSEGTLRAFAQINNPGPGRGVIAGAQHAMSADISETIGVFFTSGGGTRNAGVAGLGDPNDDFITVRASGVLNGFGAANGAPIGFSASSAGSARGVFSLSLGISNFSLGTVSYTRTELTTPTVVDTSIVENPFGSVGVGNLNGQVVGNSVVLNISKAFLQNNPGALVSFEAGLRAEARGGRFGGSQVTANYSNTAYLDFDVEEGVYWAPTGTTSTRNFLTNQVFAPVPESSTAAMLLAGLAMLGGAAFRAKRPAA
jgi:hypothetical protein